MSSQKLSSIKTPTFDKANYNQWEKNLLLFIKTANLIYPEMLKNGPYMSVVLVPETTSSSEVVPATWVPKEPFMYTDIEKQKVYIDISL